MIKACCMKLNTDDSLDYHLDICCKNSHGFLKLPENHIYIYTYCCFLLHIIIIYNIMHFYLTWALTMLCLKFFNLRYDSKTTANFFTPKPSSFMFSLREHSLWCSLAIYIARITTTVYNLLSRLLQSNWWKCRCIDSLMWMELGCERFHNTTQKWYIIWNCQFV